MCVPRSRTNVSGPSEVCSNVSDCHSESCNSVRGGDVTRRHAVLQKGVTMMLRSVNVSVALADATDDITTRALLKQAGFVLPRTGGGGRAKGGDILAPRGIGTDTKPLVVDFTVVNERTAKWVADPFPADSAEQKKCGIYRGMYDKITYGFRGFGMEIGGRLGPEAEALIQLAQGLWWDIHGKKVLPSGANWTCPSFASYWRQRLVGAVQRFNATMAVGRARRVAQLRVARDWA